MKYNAFNLNISTDMDIPFLRHGHIQDAEARFMFFSTVFNIMSRAPATETDTWVINAYPEYVIAYNRLPEKPAIGELTIYTDDLHIFYELLGRKGFLACFYLS